MKNQHINISFSQRLDEGVNEIGGRGGRQKLLYSPDTLIVRNIYVYVEEEREREII